MSADELRRAAESRVSEFLRQWAMGKDKSDLIYGVHFDAQTDEGAELLASDLARLIDGGAP